MNLLVFVILVFACLTKAELKGRYTRDVSDYDVVVPQKVSEDGGFVSYYLPHFYNEARVRRGADSGKVHYVVPIEGTNRILELLPAEDFHGPGLVIEHHEDDARLKMGSVKFRRPRKLNCYYHGWVRDDPSSSAAITTCSGLAGAITVGANHYLIEPVEEDDSPTVGPEHKHILYKRDHQKGSYNRSTCGTKGTFAAAFEERMKWEEKYGKETEKIMMGIDHSHPPVLQHQRSKRWCTTCKPKPYVKCQTPHPPCLIERPLFLEIAVVIGPRVAADKYLFKDMEQYINTIINIAAKHFQDSSLARPILIKLVRVITLEFVYEDLDPYRYEPEELLKRFCEWQTHFNPKREIHPNHHDFILYLVKFGECKDSMQGLTNMASVCRPDRACGVVNVGGLLTGHVITHMIGHGMGADHDDENVSGCLPEEPDGTCYLMAQRICTRSTSWSVCSRHCISKFTSTHAAWCMSDIPTAHDLTDPYLLPGQVYSAAEQCRINFEMDSYACLVGEFCKHLFCKISDNECVSTGEPPAQGTRCGPDQWCFNQRCVHRGSRPGATNGGWGVWSQWTPCTKTCGGGVQTASRACDSPPPSNGGRKCPGPWVKSRMCNVGACPDGGKGFLDQQCKNTNIRPYRGRKHEWLYFNQQVEDLECVVMCVNERSEVAVRSPLAIDGTFCKPGAKDVCIRGTCHPVGCDWVIGSKSKEDACGVCHGNGTECRVMQGYFTEQNFQGRMPFLKLPIGTSMILMRETRPSPCFFVIANSLNSSYYLNSDDAEERTFFAGAFTIQSTVGIYQLKANMERIFIKEPLKVPITVSVVCRNVEPAVGILYQYALPEPNHPDVKPLYTWEFLSWEKCPQSCGGAIQRAVPVCVEAQGGEVEDSYCPADSKPQDRIRVCNPRPCKAKWWVGPWSECDCYMKDGVTTRMVMCAHLKAARSYYITIVTEEECMGDEKPFSEKPCDKDAESVFWLKKGERKKRDYMDLIPYSPKVENYSVWDDNLDDSLDAVNVRELFQPMDPENVEDYLYMKKIGMSPSLWDTIQRKPQDINARVRRRKAIVTGDKTKIFVPKQKLKHKESNSTTNEKTGKKDKAKCSALKEESKHEENNGTIVQKSKTTNNHKQLNHSVDNKVKDEPTKGTRHKIDKQSDKRKPEPPKNSSLKQSEREKVKRPSKLKDARPSSSRTTAVYKTGSPSKSSSKKSTLVMEEPSRNKLDNRRDKGKLEPPSLKHTDTELKVTTSLLKDGKSTSSRRSTVLYKTDSSKKSSSKKSPETHGTESWTRKSITSDALNTLKKRIKPTEARGEGTDAPKDLFKKDHKSTEGKGEVTSVSKEPVKKIRSSGQAKHQRSSKTIDFIGAFTIKDMQKLQTTKVEVDTQTKYVVSEKKGVSSEAVKSSTEPVVYDEGSEGVTHTQQLVDSGDSTGAHKIGPVTGSESNEKNKKPQGRTFVIMVDDPPITKAVSIGTWVATLYPQKTTALSDVDRPPLATRGKLCKMESTSLTVPEVKIAPGLTPYPMYATETPPKSGKCWKMEMKHPRVNPSCYPPEDRLAEPADDPPEWDFVNTSNVKIFVVPIHTTLRTIIQNDDEFVLMETLAKYPVADEMSMVEHRGDAARRKLKIVTNQKATTKGEIQD